MGKRSYFAFESVEEVFDELRRASAGGPADYYGITYEKIEENKGVFWPCPSKDHPGTPRMFEDGFPTPSRRARMTPIRHQPPAEEPDSYRPLYLTTGRLLAHYQSGAQTRRIAKLEDISPEPLVELHPVTARRYGVGPGDRVWVETRRDAAAFKVKLTASIREDTIFLPFHWGGRQSANRLTSAALDPTSRMPEFKVCAARISLVRDE
jgi:assimilatory nitrate reductase catalytic subunit